MINDKVKTSFDGLNQKYIIKNGSQILVRKACKDDIPGISRLYESIRIDSSNLEIKLLPDHENSFVNRGGFFEVLTRQEIEKLLNNGEYIFLASVILSEDGKEEINSCLYCRLNAEAFSEMNWNLHGLSDFKKREFVEAINNRRVCTAVEHAVMPVLQSRGIAYPVIYEMYSRLADAGFVFVMLQIYTVTGIRCFNEFCPLYLQNKRSRILNEKLGAFIVGSNYVKPKTIGEKEIEIKSDVYAIEAKSAVEILSSKIRPIREGLVCEC